MKENTKPLECNDKQPQNKFYQHLDSCPQCRDNPFGLCPLGASLLVSEGTKVAEGLWDVNSKNGEENGR